MGTVPPFRDLIARTTSAVHLEMRDAYTPSDPQFLDWLAGSAIPEPALPDWHALVRAHIARGVRFRRARIVSEPLAPYIRFEHSITDATNIDAGEALKRYGSARSRMPSTGPSNGGRLPVDARPMWTLEAFTAFDDARVHVETLTAQVTVTAPGEVVVYLRAFDHLARLAVYGTDARALITSAINALG